MPVKHSALCKICNSPHRVEVEKWITEEGLSTTAAALRLYETHGEKVSHVSVWSHMRNHFNPLLRREVQKAYEKSREQIRRKEQHIEKAVQKRLSDLQMLDLIVDRNYELYVRVEQWLEELVETRAKVPQALVNLLSVTAGDIRQCLKAKQELLGEDGTSRTAGALTSLMEELGDAISQQAAS